jgi:hypothetical protein
MELQLLHGCFAPSMLSYALRTCDPEFAGQATADFDQVMREQIGRIQGAPLSDTSNLQRTLRVDDEQGVSGGGLGIPFAEDMAPVCFAASTQATAQLQSAIFAAHGLTLTPRDNTSAKNLLLQKMSQENLDDGLRAPKVQAALSRFVALHNAEALKTNLASHDGDALNKKAAQIQVARFNSLQLPKAGAWVYTLPISGSRLAMSSAAFKTALQLRLGANIFEEGQLCKCCHEPMDVYGLHALQCKKGAAGLTYRHDRMRDYWYFAAKKSGKLVPKKETPGLLGDNRRPGDIWMENYFDGAHAFDFVVTSPCCASNYVAASQGVGKSAEKAYRSKMENSAAACRAEGFMFTPVALEAFGGWHKDSLKEMKRFAEACVPVRSELEDVEKAKNRIFQEFSVKFQQITAEMIIARM